MFENDLQSRQALELPFSLLLCIRLIRSNRIRLWLIYCCLRRDDLIKRSSIKLIMPIFHSQTSQTADFIMQKKRSKASWWIDLIKSLKFKQKGTNWMIWKFAMLFQLKFQLIHLIPSETIHLKSLYVFGKFTRSFLHNLPAIISWNVFWVDFMVIL